MRKRIVVIGGGLAGSLLCNELVKRAEVTLLEIGRKNAIHYPKIGFDRKKLAEVATFCFGGGGTTNLWHNGLIPLRQSDLVSREFAEVVAEAQPFTDTAAAALFFSSEPFTPAYARMVAELSRRAKSIGLATDGIDCLMYPKKFRRLQVDRRVKDFYSVTGIDFFTGGGQVKTVTYSSGGQDYAVDTDALVVAAGAMGSPKILGQILKASGRSFDSLGTGFIDHPMGFVGKVRFTRELAGQIGQLSLSDQGDYVSRNALRLRSACGQYTCCAFFRPALTMDNSLAIYKYKSLLGASSGVARLRNAFSWKIFHPDIVAEIFSHLLGITIPSRTFNILFIAEQKRGGNRVYYNGDEVRVDWSVSAEELAVYRSLLQKLEGMLRPVAEEVNLVTDITADWLWSAAHHSSTVPLGSGGEGLVDKDLKLKFFENVFVCDGSVIQEHSYANTGLAIGQLALRLAGRILDDPQN